MDVKKIDSYVMQILSKIVPSVRKSSIEPISIGSFDVRTLEAEYEKGIGYLRVSGGVMVNGYYVSTLASKKEEYFPEYYPKGVVTLSTIPKLKGDVVYFYKGFYFYPNVAYLSVPDIFFYYAVQNVDVYAVSYGYLWKFSPEKKFIIYNMYPPSHGYYYVLRRLHINESYKEDLYLNLFMIGYADHEVRLKEDPIYVFLPVVYFNYYIRFGTTLVERSLTHYAKKVVSSKFLKELVDEVESEFAYYRSIKFDSDWVY